MNGCRGEGGGISDDFLVEARLKVVEECQEDPTCEKYIEGE